MSDAFKIGWRLAVIAVCALFLTASVWALVSSVSDQLEYRSWGQDMESYDYNLRENDYRGLKDRLDSYAPEGEQFQLYWDVADAYECYSVSMFWQQVSEDDGASAEDREAAKLYAKGYLEKLRDIYDTSGDTAKKYIDSFAGKMIR